LIFQGFAPGYRKARTHTPGSGPFGCARHKFEKRTVSGIALARAPPRRRLRLQKALAGALRREPTPIAAAHHCQKINRVGSNRRELARR
jgi:hypothetical protein